MSKFLIAKTVIIRKSRLKTTVYESRQNYFQCKSINWFKCQWVFTEMYFQTDFEKNDKKQHI